MPDIGEATPTEHAPADKRGSQEGVASSEQACMRLEQRVGKVYAYLCTMGSCYMTCVIMLVGMYCIVPIWLLNCLSVKSHIANRIAIIWIMTCCMLLVMPPASNQIAEVGPNTPAPTNNFDMQLGARTKD